MGFIKADELVKIYKTDNVEVFALQGLDIEIDKGSMLAIVGKSGSGKSTLMNLIGGLETPSAGTLIVDGENVLGRKQRQIVEYRRNKVGFVWQMSSKNLLPYLNASENIEVMISAKMPARKKREHAYKLLELVGLSGKEKSYPHQLSGGEQQRVAIAVALCNNPEIILADEPTGAVDQKTSDQIKDLFIKLNREMGITIIIVTHDLKLASSIDRTVYISDGKISTEKVRLLDAESLDEFSVLDKAGRVKLDEDMLKEAGILNRRVKINVEDGKIIVQKA